MEGKRRKGEEKGIEGERERERERMNRMEEYDRPNSLTGQSSWVHPQTHHPLLYITWCMVGERACVAELEELS